MFCGRTRGGILDIDGRYSREVGGGQNVSKRGGMHCSFHGVMDQEGIERRLAGWRKAIEKSLNWVEEE